MGNPPVSLSTKEKDLPLSVNVLEEDSSGDDDKPTDYELLLGTFKPLAKKPRLMADKRERKDDAIRSISGGGEQGRCASLREVAGEGVIGEREGKKLSDFVADEEDSCSDHGGADDSDDDDTAGKGNDSHCW